MIHGFDPVALPLWAVLLFAATMFPLGLMLPGCPCCGAECTECGVFSYGNTALQDAFGRMCCASGSVAASITVRVTSTGPASSTLVYRGTGSPYRRCTYVLNCLSIVGDYVYPLLRNGGGTPGSTMKCRWGYNVGPGIFLEPVESGAAPGWAMSFVLTLDVSATYRNQSCTMAGGIETCGFSPASNTSVRLAGACSPSKPPGDSSWGSLPFLSPAYNAENCLLSGVAVSVSTCAINYGVLCVSSPELPGSPDPSGCVYTLAVV